MISRPVSVCAGGQDPEDASQGRHLWQWERGKGLLCDAKPAEVRICGIQVPLDLPVTWLHAALRSPDNFLYVVVICTR